MRLYWDAAVWIAWNKNEEDYRSLCTSLLKDAEAGNSEIVISPLVIAEFAPDIQEDYDLFQKFLMHPFFPKVSINTYIGKMAQDFNLKYKATRGVDSLHLACAVYAKCNFLFSFDKHLLNISGHFSDIKICKPTWPDGQQRIIGT